MKKLQKKNNKKTILAVSLVGLLALLGGTIAYHTSRGTFADLFHLGYWQNETTDDVPIDGGAWKTCDELPKTVIGKNTGTVPAVVRLKYEQYWKEAGSTSTDHTSELPLLDGDDDEIATVNLNNEDMWENGGDGWYYYKYVLQPGEETSSLLKSVTLNCKNNFAGENSVCRTVGDATSCTKPDNDYDSATFHVFVTVQYLQSSGCNDVWGRCADDKNYPPKCDSNILYDHIACLSNGTDENVDFERHVGQSAMSGAGVNTVYAHKDDYYQTHYYRGPNMANFVKFNGFCWRIVRTTSTGGVKLIYNGTPNGNKCRDIYSDSTSLYPFITYNGTHALAYNSYAAGEGISDGGAADAMMPHMYGYMYKLSPVVGKTYSGNIKIGSSVRWNGRQYELQNVIDASGSTDKEHRYICEDGVSTTCDIVYFSSYAGSVWRFKLANGELLNDMIHANEADSDAKIAVDAWFRDNMLGALDKLEDTPFCNDRSFDYEHPSTSNTLAWTYLNSYYRLDENYAPSIDCEDPRDAFSVNRQNGNGKLTYPVALLTGDELDMGVAYGSNEEEYSYLYATRSVNNSVMWTMTPAEFYTNHEYAWTTTKLTYLSTGTSGYTGHGALRPVVSLKNGTRFVRGGDGSRDNPFVIE